MVDLGRGLSDAAAAYHAGEVPAAHGGRQLAGSALGVIGYGAIGSRVAQLGLALGMRVRVSDPLARVEAAGLEPVGLDALLADSDFIVCLAIANEATENLLDAAAFARVKPGAFLVNVSRGNLVDEAALAAALDSGQLAGAALDVGRAPDQMPSPWLARHPKVIATPRRDGKPHHIGGLTPTAIEHQALETVRQIGALVQEIVRGVAPPGAVNEEQARKLSTITG